MLELVPTIENLWRNKIDSLNISADNIVESLVKTNKSRINKTTAKAIEKNTHRVREELTTAIRPSPGLLLTMLMPSGCLYESDLSMRRTNQTSFRLEFAS